MFIIKIAELNIKINNKYDYLEKLCKSYITNDSNFDFEISISDEEINKELEEIETKFSLGYAESICCYRKICSIIPLYDAIVIHGAAIAVDNEGYIFMAKSGVGKTTHTLLWKKLLNDKMIYINGDKPIIRKINNQLIIYGTPWCGKENYGTNASVLLKALCFIERANENEITEITGIDLIKKLAHQLFFPKDSIQVLNKSVDLLTDITSVSCYLLKCNMDISAAKLAYEYMKK